MLSPHLCRITTAAQTSKCSRRLRKIHVPTRRHTHSSVPVELSSTAMRPLRLPNVVPALRVSGRSFRHAFAKSLSSQFFRTLARLEPLSALICAISPTIFAPSVPSTCPSIFLKAAVDTRESSTLRLLSPSALLSRLSLLDVCCLCTAVEKELSLSRTRVLKARAMSRSSITCRTFSANSVFCVWNLGADRTGFSLEGNRSAENW